MRAAMERGARAAKRVRHDPRHRLGHLSMSRRIAKVIERHGERFLDRIFTDDRTRQGRAARATGSRPMPSASPPRRPAPRRWAPACAPACCGATWAWSICRPGRPTMRFTGGALERLKAHHARRLCGAHRPHDHRRRTRLAQAFVVISAVPLRQTDQGGLAVAKLSAKSMGKPHALRRMTISSCRGGQAWALPLST